MHGSMIEQVAILGDGQMGTVCAAMLADRGLHVRLWGRNEQNIQALREFRENKKHLPGLRIPERVSFTTDAAAALMHAEMVVVAVPCQHIRPVLIRMAVHLNRDVPLVSVAKGIENGTLLRPTQIITDVLGPIPVATLSGPSIAKELAHCLPATLVTASDDDALAVLVQQAFSSQWLRVYTNEDLLGVELAGATKNVIAIAAGIVDGLKAGDNAKAALLTRGLAEIQRLGVAMGAKPDTFAGLAGLGDLVTTCISPVGRNRSAGERIGCGVPVKQLLEEATSVIEGVPTTRSVNELALHNNVSMPITHAIYGVLFEERDVLQTISDLMTRELKPEHP